MLSYSQRHGSLVLDGKLLGRGYSGHAEGKNNPAFEAWRQIGPIPQGRWRIVRWIDRLPDKGPVVAVLEPVGHNAHGRSGFLIHGDSISDPGNASHGCIILSRAIREAIRASGETDLQVTE